MQKHIQMNAYQFFILVFFFTVGSAILLIPSTLVSTARQQGWIAGLISLLIGILLSFLYAAVGRRQEHTSLLSYVRGLYGKWFSRFFALYYAFFFIILTALVLRDMGDFMTTQILTETPIMYIHIVFMSLIVYGVRLGLTTIGRFGEFLFPWFLFLFLMLFALVAPEAEYRNILPVFPLDSKSIIKASLSFTGFPFLELCVFLIIQPYVNDTSSLQKAFSLGTLLGGLVLIVLIFQCILVMSPELTSTFLYPSYELAKHIQLDQFIERIEVVMAVLWFMSLFFKIAITFWVSVMLLGEVMGLESYGHLTIPLAVIVLVYSITMSPNVMFISFSAQVWPFYACVTGAVLPLLLLRRRKS